VRPLGGRTARSRGRATTARCPNRGMSSCRSVSYDARPAPCLLRGPTSKARASLWRRSVRPAGIEASKGAV